MKKASFQPCTCERLARCRLTQRVPKAVSNKTPPRVEGQRKLVDALVRMAFARADAFLPRVPAWPGLCRSDKNRHGQSGLEFPFPEHCFSQLDGLSRHFRFRQSAVAGNGLDRMAIAIAGGKIHLPVNPRRDRGAESAPPGSWLSTNSRQSSAPRKRRLSMVWLTETWSAAWFWLSRWTSCSTKSPCSVSVCSSQLRARCIAGLWRDKR